MSSYEMNTIRLFTFAEDKRFYFYEVYGVTPNGTKIKLYETPT
jgi:hypothetical protein